MHKRSVRNPRWKTWLKCCQWGSDVGTLFQSADTIDSMRSKPSASVQHASQPHHSLGRRLRWSHPLPHTHSTHTHTVPFPLRSLYSLFFTVRLSRDTYYSYHPPILYQLWYCFPFYLPSCFLSIALFFREIMLGVFFFFFLFSSLVEDDFLSVCCFSSTALCHLSQGSWSCQRDLSEVMLGVPLHFTWPWCDFHWWRLAEGVTALLNPFSRGSWRTSVYLCMSGARLLVQTALDLMCELTRHTGLRLT